MKTLAIKYAPREGSRTGKIFDAYIAGLEDVTVRDISDISLPNITSDVMAEFMTEDKTTDYKKLSETLTQELKAAERVIIATPMYNFSLPAQVKSYIDLVCIAGQTFEYTDQGPEGLVDIKDATIISTSGGVRFGSPVDMLTPILNTVINFWSKNEVAVKQLTAEGLSTMSEDAADQKVADIIASL